MAVLTKYIEVTVTSMEYRERDWVAKGHVIVKDTGKVLDWEATHRSTLIVKLGDDWKSYPEEMQSQVRSLVKSTLGYVNLPYSRTYTVTLR